MLSHLEIKNVALIDEVILDFGEGFNVMTGETGAGKSIIIDSICALLGERISRDIIRSGREKAVIEAVFTSNACIDKILSDNGIDNEENIIISREVYSNGKSICRINGKLATVSLLKQIGGHIIDVHGQHENQSLLQTSGHIDLVDAFAGTEIASIKKVYAEKLDQYKRCISDLNKLNEDMSKREQKIDMLGFQVDEIGKARLKTGEDEELIGQRTILINHEKIINSLNAAYERLYSNNNSAVDCLKIVATELNAISGISDDFTRFYKTLEGIIYDIDDLVADIRQAKDGMEYDPGMLNELEERLDLIHKLKRKYGSGIEEVLEYCSKAQADLDRLTRADENARGLESHIRSIESELLGLSRQMHEKRRIASEILQTRITGELEELDMNNTKFTVRIIFTDTPVNTDSGRMFHQNGLDSIEFLISTNKGEMPRPLGRIASGGEISRVMLAIKKILADVDNIPTMIFDEIDNGIGGRASGKVGEKLSDVAKNHQVICVTHLPQIACMADDHFFVEKYIENDITKTKVKKLNDNEAITEIARLLDGANISEITLKHSEEMLSKARCFKHSKV